MEIFILIGYGIHSSSVIILIGMNTVINIHIKPLVNSDSVYEKQYTDIGQNVPSSLGVLTHLLNAL